MVAMGLPDACFAARADVELGVARTKDANPEWRPEQGVCVATGVAQRRPEHLRVTADIEHAGYLILRLRSYPEWRVRVNGLDVGMLPTRADGLIAAPVSAGAVDVAVDWIATGDVVAGRALSVLCAGLLVGIWVSRRRVFG